MSGGRYEKNACSDLPPMFRFTPVDGIMFERNLRGRQWT